MANDNNSDELTNAIKVMQRLGLGSGDDIKASVTSNLGPMWSPAGTGIGASVELPSVADTLKENMGDMRENIGDQNGSMLGKIGTGVGIVKDLAGLYMGWKQMKMAKQQLRDNRAFGNRNVANQARTTNASLEGLYRAGLHQSGANSGRESVDSYMTRNRVDGSQVA